MGKFGWSYPPGVTSLPWDHEGPCEVCGKSIDICICPECPVCSEHGNPKCYLPGPIGHGQVRTFAQRDGLAELERAMEAEAKAEAKWAEEMVAAKEEAW
jgi:hypothetical protein